MNELLCFHLITGPPRHQPPRVAPISSNIMQFFKMHPTQPTRDLPALRRPTRTPRFLLLKPEKPLVIPELSLPQQSGAHDPELPPCKPKQRIMLPARFDLVAKLKSTSLVLKWNELPERASNQAKEKYILTILLMTLQDEVLSEQVFNLSKNTHTVDDLIPNVRYMVTVESMHNPQIRPETIVYPRRECKPQLAHMESTHINH